VYQKGDTIRGPHCALKYIFNKRRRTYRIAVVVSRKVHKSAVVRNRIRRRIYEIVRSESDRIVRPYDLVLTVYSDVLAEMPAAQLRQVVLEKLEKAEVFTTPGQRALEGRGIVEPKEN
jgi:ribonuclease P protein component